MAEGFVYGGNTVLSHPIFVETILPFLLVFTIVFAILQKTEILGKGKKQVDAIVGLVAGLLVISFASVTGLIIQIIPFLAVALVVILVFMILVGSFHSKGDFFSPGMKTFMMVLAFIAVAIAVVFFTGFWEYLYDLIFQAGDSTLFANSIFILIMIGAVVWVLWSAGKGGSE